jgi:Cu-Zn family superoxide dismutase
MRIRNILFVILSFFIFSTIQAKEINVNMHTVNDKGIGGSIGEIIFKDTQFGLLVVPDLQGLSPGNHGIHIHQNPSCNPAEKDGKSVAALSAGGHLDPDNTHRHKGPYKNGHIGDLPVLTVGNKGDATTPVLAPKLTVDNILNHSVIIHINGDNYSDDPKPLGGGGARIACGIIPK